jgi:uncharacterized protein YecE (DUF72 family)
MRDGNFVTGPELRPWPRDVYVYFDNTDKLHAPDNARGLMQRLGVSACASAPVGSSARLAADTAERR